MMGLPNQGIWDTPTGMGNGIGQVAPPHPLPGSGTEVGHEGGLKVGRTVGGMKEGKTIVSDTVSRNLVE